MRLTLLALLLLELGCYDVPNLGGKACDDAHTCVQGFACVDNRCIVPIAEGEGEAGEGEAGEGEGGEGEAGEGEGEAGEGEGDAGEGEGDAGEGEGEGDAGEGEGEGEGDPAPLADVFREVPGLDGYSLVYSVQLPSEGALYDVAGAAYAFDGSAALSAPFTRVGWFLELQQDAGPLLFAYVEADAPSTSPADIGFPTTPSGAFLQDDLQNAFVVTNAPGVTAGDAAVNAEMWPSDYGESNDSAATSPAAADDAVFDFGDGGADQAIGYGSLQLHNTSEGRTILAVNDWGDNAGALDVGIGNQPTDEPDWTFASNAGGFVVKNFQVVVNAALDAPAMPAEVPGVPANIALHVPADELAGYRLVYDLDIPLTAQFEVDGAVPYDVDAADLVPAGSFDRIAYYVELDDAYVWVSAAAFTLDAGRTGVPLEAAFQHRLDDGRVFSNVVAEGTALAALQIEFWPMDYETQNGLPVAGASDASFDFGDIPTDGSYGSMQIHDAAAGETLFGYSHWGTDDVEGDLGIGSNPAGEPDWTFAGNTGSYTTRRLQVLVHAR